MSEVACPLPLRDKIEVNTACAKTAPEALKDLLFSYADKKPSGCHVGDTFTVYDYTFVVYGTAEYVAAYALEEADTFSDFHMVNYLRTLHAKPDDILYFVRYRLNVENDRMAFFERVYDD